MSKRIGTAAGFGVLELLITVSLFAFIGAAFIAAYLTADRLVRQGLSQTKIQSFGRIGMEKIERYVRGATSAVILSGGDQVQFVVDTNANPLSQNLVTRSLTFSTGDGDETTANDNTLIYDPNILVAGDEEVVMTNVRKITGSNIFSVSGKMITVNLRTFDVIPAYQEGTYTGSSVEVRTQIYMRN